MQLKKKKVFSSQKEMRNHTVGFRRDDRLLITVNYESVCWFGCEGVIFAICHSIYGNNFWKNWYYSIFTHLLFEEYSLHRRPILLASDYVMTSFYFLAIDFTLNKEVV